MIGKFSICDINIEKLVKSIDKDIIITGIINIDGNFEIKGNDINLETLFYSKTKKGIKQFMNFGALELLTSLSGSNPIKKVGESNFYYKTIFGKVIIKNGLFTIEGLAGEKNGKQYLMIKPILLPGINILIDRKNNTIELSDLIKRIKIAIERVKM